MKPSDRIYKLADDLQWNRNHPNDLDEIQAQIRAIISYLDEEYEQRLQTEN